MHEDERQNDNTWVPPVTVATCTSRDTCANLSPCGQCVASNRDQNPPHDPHHPLRTDSDPVCAAIFAHPIDGPASSVPSAFKQLIYARCPNVVVPLPNGGGTYLDHGCYPGRVLHTYTMENISSTSQQECLDHAAFWQGFAPGVCMSSTGHPVNLTSPSETECTRRYGVDRATRVELRQTCARCAADSAASPDVPDDSGGAAAASDGDYGDSLEPDPGPGSGRDSWASLKASCTSSTSTSSGSSSLRGSSSKNGLDLVQQACEEIVVPQLTDA
jgi:hypothetical protein